MRALSCPAASPIWGCGHLSPIWWQVDDYFISHFFWLPRNSGSSMKFPIPIDRQYPQQLRRTLHISRTQGMDSSIFSEERICLWGGRYSKLRSRVFISYKGLSNGAACGICNSWPLKRRSRGQNRKKSCQVIVRKETYLRDRKEFPNVTVFN